MEMDVLQIILSFAGPLLYIIGLTGTFIYIFKKKLNFQFLLPIALISATLFVFFFTFVFHSIAIGLIVTALGAAAFIPLVILDKERGKMFRELFFTPGFVIFILLYAFLFVWQFNSVFALYSDDTMHWGPHIWAMWVRDDFYVAPGVNVVIHGDYPPILQLFGTMWSRLAGVYREGLLYIALQILSFSMLFPVLKNLTWQTKKNLKMLFLSILILVGLLVSPTLVDVTHLFYNSLHPDYIIAFIFVLGVYAATLESRKFSWRGAILLSLIITFLYLTKQASILFGGLIGLIYLISLYHSYGLKIKAVFHNFVEYVIKNFKKNWKKIAAVILLLFLPILTIKLWSFQTRDYNENPYCCVAMFSISPTDPLKIPSILMKKSGTESQQNYAREFFRYVATYNAGFTMNIFSNVSYMQFILLFIGVAIFMGFNYKDKFRRHKFIIVMSVVVAGWFVYMLAIYCTFLFGGMNDGERANMLTGDRYLRTYIFAMFMILFLIFVRYTIDGAKANNRTVGIFAFVLAVVGGLLFNIDILKNGYLVEARFKFIDEYAAYGIDHDGLWQAAHRLTDIAGGTYENPKKILVTEWTHKPTQLVRYYLLPNLVENDGTLVIDEKLNQEQLCEKLDESDYILVNHIYRKEQMDRLNSCLSEKVETFSQYDVYEIKHEDGKLLLVRRAE